MTPAYENGDNCSLSSIGRFYNAYDEMPHSPVSNRFFAPENVVFLQQQLERALTLMVGQPVKVAVNEEFTQSMYDIASQNGGLAYLGQTGLNQLNEMFLEWEARIQYVSIRQQKRYEQYFLKEDRQLVMPYPPSDRTMKGEVVIDTSGYTLTSPWKNNFGNFLQDVLHIGPLATPPCPSNAPGACPYSPLTRT